MAMTAAVKDELSRLAVSKTCCRRAEVSSLLRFAGGLHIVGGRVVVEAELDTRPHCAGAQDVAGARGHSAVLDEEAKARALRRVCFVREAQDPVIAFDVR